MCQVSDKLKLCSCKTKNVENLKHYWILNRYAERDDFIIGHIMPPYNLTEEDTAYNIDTLQNILNSGNCFDVQMNLADKDILELHFSCKQIGVVEGLAFKSESKLVYAFKYEEGRWEQEEYDPFGNNLNRVDAGKISRALIKE